MSHSLTTPELYRAPIDIPDIPYDALLRASAERYPTHTAIIYGSLVLTYREVVSQVNSLANGLSQLGLRKGDHLCTFITNRPEYSILLNAAATIGAVFSPINPAYKARELAYQLADAEAKAILVQRELLPLLQLVLNEHEFPHLHHIIVTGESVPATMPEAIPFARLIRESSPRRPAPVQIEGNDLLALPYSSGTTGLPKGVMLSHRNLVANHTQFLTAARITEADTTVIFLPLYHIYGVLLTGSFLSAGATQILVERFDMHHVLDLCEQYNVTWFFTVPPVLLALNATSTDLLKRKMHAVRYVMSAAAPLAPVLAQAIQDKLGVTVAQGYGLTESSPDTHFSPLEPTLIRLDSVGLLASNTEHRVVDQETGERELEPGEIGEILVRGPQVMLGYWKAPEETACALRNGWLHTGDIGYVDEKGYLFLVDRKKEMIKYKGFSIAPAELEALLLSHPAVKDAAVIGVPDEEAGELPKGFVVLQAEQEISDDELLAFVSARVSGYKKLHAVEFIDALPRVPSGKLLRRELKERERQARVTDS